MNSNFELTDLPRSFNRCILRDEPLDARHRARSQLGIGGRGDYALLHLLIHCQCARYHALSRTSERSGNQRHGHDDAVRRGCRRLGDNRGLGLRHRHYHRRGGSLRSDRRARRRLNRALDFHLQSMRDRMRYRHISYATVSNLSTDK